MEFLPLHYIFEKLSQNLILILILNVVAVFLLLMDDMEQERKWRVPLIVAICPTGLMDATLYPIILNEIILKCFQNLQKETV